MSTGAWVGVLELDALLGDVHSLKHKRAVLRPVLARLRRMDVCVSEVGEVDLHRRAHLAVVCVSGEPGHVTAVLDTCERQVAGELELQLLSASRRMIGPED